MPDFANLLKNKKMLKNIFKMHTLSIILVFLPLILLFFNFYWQFNWQGYTNLKRY